MSKPIKYQPSPRLKEVLDAKDFVSSYYNSPGFSERFHNLNKVLQNYRTDKTINTSGDLYQYGLFKYPLKISTIDTRDDSEPDNGKYDYKTGRVSIGKWDSTKSFGSYAGVAAHEFGHAVDNSIDLKSKFKDYGEDYGITPNKYSAIFPVFRKSKSYQKLKDALPQESRESLDLIPELFYELSHDAMPSESYADLMNFRYLLLKSGVFDSRKAGQIFTKDHLQLYRKSLKYAPLRLFDNFNDDDIIWMMNNVASNDLSQSVVKAQAGWRAVNKTKSSGTWGKYEPLPRFNWLENIGKTTGNLGYWGKGNYFATGEFKGAHSNALPYMINGVKEIAYDDLLGATNAAEKTDFGAKTATEWMEKSPHTRVVAATPEGYSNIYGYLDDGRHGIEIVTLKNTGIKSLNPDLTIGNGKTFPRNWSNPDAFKTVIPITLGTSALYQTNKKAGNN